MIGIILVTHGNLAIEFRQAVEHVVGQQKNLQAIAIGADDNMETRRKDIVKAVSQVDTGCGVIILTDMFGGTPSNLAISIMQPGEIEVIAGVNLPMLVKLASVRCNCDMAQAIEAARDSGRKYITVASEMLDD